MLNDFAPSGEIVKVQLVKARSAQPITKKPEESGPEFHGWFWRRVVVAGAKFLQHVETVDVVKAEHQMGNVVRTFDHSPLCPPRFLPNQRTAR